MTDKQAPESRGTEVLAELVEAQAKHNEWGGTAATAIRLNKAWSEARALLATQRSTEPADGWISVKETPIPRDGGSFIVTDGKTVAPHVGGVIANNTGTSWDWQYGEAITHWMPLPNAPGREAEPAVRGDARLLIKECLDALATELTAWDLDPPLAHVKKAHDRCIEWLAQTPEGKDET